MRVVTVERKSKQVIVLNIAEFKAIMQVIGRTSHPERIRLGLSEGASKECSKLYQTFYDLKL